MAKKKKSAPRRKPVPVYEEPGFSIPMPALVRDNPFDSAALLIAAAAACAILINALMLQGVKPAPRQAASSAVVVPAPRPAAVTLPAEPAPAVQKEDPNMLVREVQAELARRGLYDGPVDGAFGPKTEAAIFDFEIGAGLKPNGRPNPELLAAMRTSTQPAVAASPRVASVQRVLDEQGFGPVKADGVSGEATRAAIRRFETSRGLLPKGDITPALLRELTEVSGVKFD